MSPIGPKKIRTSNSIMQSSFPMQFLVQRLNPFFPIAARCVPSLVYLFLGVLTWRRNESPCEQIHKSKKLPFCQDENVMVMIYWKKSYHIFVTNRTRINWFHANLVTYFVSLSFRPCSCTRKRNELKDHEMYAKNKKRPGRKLKSKGWSCFFG